MSSSRILAFPSVSSQLDKLPYATSIANVPLHAGPNGRANESQEMLKRGLSHPGAAPQKGSVLASLPAPSGDMLTMRRKNHP